MDKAFVRFFAMFGFSCSGFWFEWGKTICSVCSVDFVDKMWENLWENWWESWGKKCGKDSDSNKMRVRGGMMKVFRQMSGKVNEGNVLCKIGGFPQFPQFPHSLLLQLI